MYEELKSIIYRLINAPDHISKAEKPTVKDFDALEEAFKQHKNYIEIMLFSNSIKSRMELLKIKSLSYLEYDILFDSVYKKYQLLNKDNSCIDNFRNGVYLSLIDIRNNRFKAKSITAYKAIIVVICSATILFSSHSVYIKYAVKIFSIFATLVFAFLWINSFFSKPERALSKHFSGLAVWTFLITIALFLVDTAFINDLFDKIIKWQFSNFPK